MSVKALCFSAVRHNHHNHNHGVHCIRPFVRLFFHLSGQILLPQYLINGLSNLDEADSEYSLALLMTWLDSGIQRSVSASQQAVEVAMLVRRSPLSSSSIQAWQTDIGVYLFSHYVTLDS